MKIFVIMSTLAGLWFVAGTGCYTQFATLNYSTPTDSLAQIDTTKVHVVEKVDTVKVLTREKCYWTRNFFGEPELQCYPDYYSNRWDRYYNSPWWYRFDQVYGYDYCPPHYYYDPLSDGCRWDFRSDWNVRNDWDRRREGYCPTCPSYNGYNPVRSSSAVPPRTGNRPSSTPGVPSSSSVSHPSPPTSTSVPSTGINQAIPSSNIQDNSLERTTRRSNSSGIPDPQSIKPEQPSAEPPSSTVQKSTGEKAVDMPPPAPEPQDTASQSKNRLIRRSSGSW